MKNIKRIISGLISASMLISCINTFAEEPDLVERLSLNKSAVELSEAISELTQAQLTELGIKTTEYEQLEYPEFVAEEMLVQGFSTKSEFKTAFDSAMSQAIGKEKIVASYGVGVRTEDTTADGYIKPGVTFANALSVYNTELFLGFDVPNSIDPMGIDLTVTYTNSNFGQASRNSVLYSYSLNEYPSTPKTDSNYTQDSNYDKSTQIYADWLEFVNGATDIAKANRKKWSIDKGATPPEVTNSLNDEIITALSAKLDEATDKTATTPLSVKMGRGDNLSIVCNPSNASTATPYLTIKYDKTKVWNNTLAESIEDGATGVHNVSEITLDYSAELDSSTWTSENISLINDETNQAVSISTDTVGKITINDELEDETSYVLSVKNIMDTDGNSLKNRRIYFTTAGIYKGLYFTTTSELTKGNSEAFKVFGKMSKKDVDVTNEATITSSDESSVKYDNGEITAVAYGYSEISAKLVNVDTTSVQKNILILVPATKAEYKGEEINYSQFAIIAEFNDDLNTEVQNGFGFSGATIGINREHYTINGNNTEAERSNGAHKAYFVVNDSNVLVYIDDVKIGDFTLDDMSFTVADYLTNKQVLRLCDTTPIIKNLTVSGKSENDAVIGDTLTAAYDVFDADGDETTAEGAWYISDSENGKYTELSKENSIEIKKENVSKYVKYSVKAINALAEGDTVSTEPIKISLGKTLEKLLNDIQNTDVQSVKEILEANAELIGVDLSELQLLEQPGYVYGELANTSFTDIEDIIAKFGTALNKYLLVEKYPVTAAHRYGPTNGDAIFTNITNEQRQQLYLIKGLLTLSPIKNAYAVKELRLNAYSGGSAGNDSALSTFFINEPWDFTDMTVTAQKLTAETALKSGSLAGSGYLKPNNTMQTFTLENVVESLTEGCALTVRFENTGNNMLYLNGAAEDQKPSFEVVYDKTAIMKKEAVFDMENGKQEVAHNLNAINVEFLRDVDEASVNTTNITLVKDSNNTPVSISIRKTEENKFAIEIPQNSLEPETTYRLEMKNISDGEAEFNNQIIRFTTETLIKNLSLEAKTSYAIGESANMVVNGLTVNKNVKRMSGIEFKSSNPEVASIDSTGKITAVKRGTATISASYTNYDGSKAEQKLIVNVYNHNTGESFETNSNAKNTYSYSGVMSLPIDGKVELHTSKYNNYAEANYYDDGVNANAELTFGGVSVNVKSTENSKGWHQIVFDNRGEKLTAYLDGKNVGEGVFAGENTLTANGSGIYVDNVNINDISGTVCTVQNVAVRGSVTVGGELSANYGYIDSDNDKEDGTIIKWYYSSSQNGSYSFVAQSAKYKTAAAGYYKVGISPKNMYETGEEILSPAFYVGSNSTQIGGGTGSTGGSISRPATSNDINLEVNKNKGFSDVPSSHWAYESINEMKNKKIVNGITEKEFEPDGNVTRAQFAVMLVRAIGKSESEYKNTFKDVNIDDWFAKYVQTAFDEGLISGFDGDFAPNDNITREQMVKMIICAYQKLNPSYKLDGADITFDDMDSAADWSREYIQAACALKIVSGMGNNKFAPKENATRAQAAVMINNMLK